MSQWQKWLKGFVTGWYASLAGSLSSLDSSTRSQFESAFSEANLPDSRLADFNDAWKNLGDSESVMKKVRPVLDSLDDLSSEDAEYLRSWFSVLMAEMSHLPQDVQSRLLSSCGRTCASHMTSKFREIWSLTGNLEDFVAELNKQLARGSTFYTYIDENTIGVSYPRCFCPLVEFDLIDSPTLCNCSNTWIQTNLQGALLRTASVEKLSTVLEGAEACSFRVNLAD